jgi:hypothetical protein
MVLAAAIEVTQSLKVVTPTLGDDLAHWLPKHVANALLAHGIGKLSQLSFQISRRRRWWVDVPGLGQTGAR